jgi:hypothetical protein
MELIVQTTSSSSSEKANSSSVRLVDILMLILRMQKENTLPLLLKTIRSNKNGELSTKIKHPIKLDLVKSMILEVFMSTDHSSLYLECG